MSCGSALSRLFRALSWSVLLVSSVPYAYSARFFDEQVVVDPSIPQADAPTEAPTGTPTIAPTEAPITVPTEVPTDVESSVTQGDTDSSFAQSGTHLSVDLDTKLKYQHRVERFVETAWVVGTGLGMKTATIEQCESRIRTAGQWALEHRLPMPSGFSLFADAEAGFVIGTKLGSELVFLVPDEGNVQMAVYWATDSQAGAGAVLGAGVGINLIFNMEKVEDVTGPMIGISTEIHMLEGVGASLSVDVERHEFSKVRKALRAMVLENPEQAVESLRQLISEKRLVAVGAQYSWGVGVNVSLVAGWRHWVTSLELPSDPAEVKARLAQLKKRVRAAFSKQRKQARIKVFYSRR